MPRAVAASLVAMLLAGCGSPTATPSAAASAPVGTVAPSSSSTAPTLTAVLLPEKGDSTRGPIWLGVPPHFPLPAAATPAERGPDVVSGAFDVPASAGDTRAVTKFYVDSLKSESYNVSVDGPLEDGSFDVNATGPGYGLCDLHVVVAPLGELTRLTVFYGERCEYF